MMNISKLDSVTSSLLAYISENMHSAGERLPAERTLAEILGTSRNTVREALSTLRERNILEIRRGSGCYIKSMPAGADIKGLTKSASRIIAQHQLETRYMLEPAVAELAMERISEKNISQLEAAIVGLSQAIIHRNYSDIIEHDNLFRRILAQSTGNPILTGMMHQLEMNTHHTWQLLSDLPEDALSTIFANYVKTLNAIRERDIVQVKRHIENIITTLCELLMEYSSLDFPGILCKKNKGDKT